MSLHCVTSKCFLLLLVTSRVNSQYIYIYVYIYIYFIQVIYTALINFSAQYALVYQFDAVPVGTIPVQQFD